MKTYLLSLISAAMLAILVSLLSPEGDRGGIAKHMRLIISLFLVCVLISPVQALIRDLPDLLEKGWHSDAIGSVDHSEYHEQLTEAINQASAEYFTDMLTQTLCAELSISQEELRCKVFWDTSKSEMTPLKVTVFLSGKAIWKDPAEIRALIGALIGCECDVIID